MPNQIDDPIKKHSPLTETTYYILVSLTETLHGYGVIKKVEHMSNGRIKLAAGTLYGAFNALVKHELIEAKGTDPDNPRRKLYCMTQKGRKLIEYEINRLQAMVDQGSKELDQSR